METKAKESEDKENLPKGHLLVASNLLSPTPPVLLMEQTVQTVNL